MKNFQMKGGYNIKFEWIIFGIAILALIISMTTTAFAFPFCIGDQGQNPIQNMSGQERESMVNFTESLNVAIANNDFQAWKFLIESQLTEENFNKVVEAQNHLKVNVTDDNRTRIGAGFPKGNSGKPHWLQNLMFWKK
jgi:hypothetical protein